MENYYFFQGDMLIFDDIAYADDNPYWYDPNSWMEIPNHPEYVLSVIGDIVRKSDSYRLQDEDIEMHNIIISPPSLNFTSSSFESESESETDTVDVDMGEVIDTQYLDNYPILMLVDERAHKWYRSITHMLSVTQGTEGMRADIIYKSCNQREKCYGKKFIWDPLLYVKYELLKSDSKFHRS
jgi:hypothetical protein